MTAPVPASAARAGVEAAARRAVRLLGGEGGPLGGSAVSVIMAAADAYRDALPDDDGRDVHLLGAEGTGTACRARWTDPGALARTGNPAAVSRGACTRSLRYRAMTGAGSG